MIACFPQWEKPKSRLICEAFAEGVRLAGGEAQVSYKSELQGTPFFYGVVGLEELWRKARAGEFFYGDNSFFDLSRGTHFRVGKNALQTWHGLPNYERFQALGVEVKPWRRDGRYIVVAMQSEHFMSEVAGWPGGVLMWQEHVLQTLKLYTDRPIVVRHWSRDKNERAKTLRQDLDGAWALVTHASAAANEAVLDGVPVFVTGPCAALPMGLSQLQSIEYPARPDGRCEWAATLANLQWTISEFRDGTAWRSLQ